MEIREIWMGEDESRGARPAEAPDLFAERLQGVQDMCELLQAFL